MVDIYITNDQEALPVDEPLIRRAIDAILRDAGVTGGEISIAIVDEPTLTELHDRFMNDNSPTDVMSFVLDRSEDGARLEGEVVVSADMAVDRAEEYNMNPSDELLLYIIHGTLHLVGYDDIDAKDRAEMRQQEQKYLTELEIGPNR